MLTPDVIGEHRAGDDLSRMADEEFEHPEFARRELDAAAAALGAAAGDVDLKIRDLEQRGGVARATQQRLQASEQLRKGERLGKIVVGSRVKPGDAVLDGPARRENQHRRIDASLAELLEKRAAVGIREPEVEHDRVVRI